jgi:hypothetical protein
MEKNNEYQTSTCSLSPREVELNSDGQRLGGSWRTAVYQISGMTPKSMCGGGGGGGGGGGLLYSSRIPDSLKNRLVLIDSFRYLNCEDS